MTIESTINRKEYNGNGVTTNFSFPYLFLADGDLKVYKDGVLQTITTHYTVSGAGDLAGGTVAFVTAPPVGTGNVVILNDPAITQTFDPVDGDELPAESMERAFDRLTIIAQRLSSRVDRAFHLPDNDSSGASVVLPGPEPNALVGWNASADALVNVDPDDIATVAGSANWTVDFFAAGTHFTAGTTTVLTLSTSPGSGNNCQVYFDGVRQNRDTFTVSGTTITFDDPIPGDTLTVEIVMGSVLTDLTEPSDGSVTTAKIENDAVTTAKLAARAVTFPKVAAIATGTVLGRSTAESGDVEVLTAQGALLLSGSTIGVMARRGGVGITGQPNAGTPLTQYDLDAHELTLVDSAGRSVVRLDPGAALTCNINTAGPAANGRDQAGAFAGDSWVHFYWIWNGTTLATLASATAPPTGPTLPTGYTHWTYAGAVRLDGSLQLRRTYIRGATAYMPTQVAVVTNYSPTVNVENTHSVSDIVPPNALSFTVLHSGRSGSVASNVKLRFLTNTDYFFPPGTANISTRAVTVEMPNIDQQFFSIRTAGDENYDLRILSFKIPNGGE